MDNLKIPQKAEPCKGPVKINQTTARGHIPLWAWWVKEKSLVTGNNFLESGPKGPGPDKETTIFVFERRV